MCVYKNYKEIFFFISSGNLSPVLHINCVLIPAPENLAVAFGLRITEFELTAILLMFIFLCGQESERKAYNPRPFCKTYTMDKQPLNTGEQKDMTEFFTDLITKIEEMSQELVNDPLFLICSCDVFKE